MPDEPAFRSAEEWLAAAGVEREPIRVTVPPQPQPQPQPEPQPVPQAPPEPATPAPAEPSDEPAARGPGDLDDEVRRALAFIRRSTASQPASEGRLRDKLSRRDIPRAAIDLALERARGERLVDDVALANALVAERRAKGHAATRIRKDLRHRGLPDDLINQVLASTDDEDPEAVAFGVARARATSYGALDDEAAYRRLVGYLARRGHAEGLARKVAREVIYAEREAARVAEH